MQHKSLSEKETIDLGLETTKEILSQKAQATATVIALQGDLGSGKTTFAKGMLRGLGVGRRIQSPTFILIRKHKIKNSRFKHAFHADAYRLKDHLDAKSTGLSEIIQNPENILIVEWPEKIKKLLPKKTTWLKFSHEKNPGTRLIRK